MKKRSLFFVLAIVLMISIGCSTKPKNIQEADLLSPDELHDLLVEGAKYHDEGNFDKAIQCYEIILKQEPNNENALHEIAYSTLTKGDLQAADKYIERGIKLHGSLLDGFYLQKANLLDMQQKPEKALKYYKKAEKLNPNNYLIPFNIAITYINKKEYENAQKYLLKALQLNPNHSSSHFYLALLCENNNRTIQALLAYARFCSIERQGERYEFVVQKIAKLMNSNVKENKKNNSTVININSLLFSKPDAYSSIELFFTLGKAVKLTKEKESLTLFDLKAQQIESLLKYLSELQGDEKPNDTFWHIYTPYFFSVLEKDYVKPLAVFMFNTKEDESVRKWASANIDKINEFIEWTDNFKQN